MTPETEAAEARRMAASVAWHRRIVALPVLACPGCGDDMVLGLACAPCRRRAELRRRLATKAMKKAGPGRPRSSARPYAPWQFRQRNRKGGEMLARAERESAT